MKNKKNPAGQSLVEFALVFPIVFLLFVGFIDIGRALYVYSSLSNAVREGTRYAIVSPTPLNDAYNGDDSAIETKVRAYLFGMKTTAINPNITVIVTKDSETDANTDVQITANYCFKAITPFINKIFGNKCPSAQSGILLTVDSTMHVSPVAH